MASVFISYSRADVDFVRRLSDALSRSGYTAWMDLQSIPPSAEWLQEIQAGIEGADAFLAVLSPDYLASSTCREEVQHAVEMKKRIIPLVRRDVDASAVPTELAALNWIFFREGDAFEEALEKLTFALETDLAYWHNSARLLTRALEWKARRQDVSRALRGAELTEAERWLVVGAGKKPTPTALQTEFITWSRRAATRRQRTLTVALAVGLLLTLGLSIFSFVQYRSATSEAQTLRAQAIAGDADAALLANRLDQALLLGVEAVRHDNTLQARTTLFRALETGAYVSTVLQSGSQRVPSQYALLAGFSADGRTVASATSGGHVTVWDVPSRQVRSQFDVACHPLSGAALSADGGLVATLGAEVGNACQPQGVDVWDGRTGRPVQHLAEPTMLPGVVGINSVPLAFGPSGTLLAMAACEDAQCGAAFVDVWDASSGVRQQRLPLDGPNARMVSIAFSPDGNLLAANECSDICHVVVWTVSNGARLYSFPRADAAHPDWSVGAIAFGHHSALLAVAGGPASTNQGAILFLDARTGSPTGQPVFQNGGSISSMDFSPDDSLLVTNTLGTANLQLWEVATGDPASPPLVGHADPATRVMFSPVGLVFASSGYDGSVLLWRTKPLSDHTLTPGSGPPAGTSEVLITPDGSSLMTWDAASEVSTWDFDSGVRRETLPPSALVGTNAEINALQVSPDGHLLAIGTYGAGVTFWDRKARRALGPTVSLPQVGYIWGLAFSPDGRYLAAWANAGQQRGIAYLVDVSTGRVLHAFQGATQLAFTPDSRSIAAAMPASAGHSVQGYDIATGKSSYPLAGDTGDARSVAFSPDGKLMATLDAADVATLWDRGSGRPSAHFTLGAERPTFAFDLAFSPKGDTLAATDGTNIGLWEVTANQPLVQPILDSQNVNNVVFSPDGAYLIEAEVSGQVVVRAATVGGWEAQACAIAGRNLSAAEWAAFFGGEPYHRTCGPLSPGADPTASSGPPTMAEAPTPSSTPTPSPTPQPMATRYSVQVPGPGCTPGDATWQADIYAPMGRVDCQADGLKISGLPGSSTTTDVYVRPPTIPSNDYDVSVTLHDPQGYWCAGVLARQSDAGYYMFMLCPHAAASIDAVGGTSAYQSIATGIVPQAASYHLKVSVRGDSLEMYVDGALVLSAKDNQLPSGDEVGIFESGDTSSVVFSDFEYAIAR